MGEGYAQKKDGYRSKRPSKEAVRLCEKGSGPDTQICIESQILIVKHLHDKPLLYKTALTHTYSINLFNIYTKRDTD